MPTKNLPSKRASRASLARLHACQSRVIARAMLTDLAEWSGRFRTPSNRVRERPVRIAHRAYVDVMRKLTMAVAMLATLSLAAQTTYQVIVLPDLGASGQANSINNRGWVAGGVNLPGGVYSEATAWINGSLVRLGTLGGPNSLVGWPVENNDGVIVGISEVSAFDTLGESGSSCQYFFPTTPPSGHACQGFRWQNGVMTALPTLGGTNSYATAANNRGQIVGWAENKVHDPTCAGSQVLQFRAVIWGPQPGQIQELPPLPGDSV